MRLGLKSLVIVAAVTAGAVGQPKDGDLILSGWDSRGVCALLFVDATSGKTTIGFRGNPSQGGVAYIIGNIRMAANNRDLVISETIATTRSNYQDSRGRLVRVDLANRTSSTLRIFRAAASHRLDFDGTWVASGFDRTAYWSAGKVYSSQTDELAGITPLAKTTYHSVVTSISGGSYGPLLIDRDPGAAPYVFSVGHSLLRADRGGILGTVLTSLRGLGGLELDELSGDYVFPSSTHPLELRFVAKSGKLRRVLKTSAHAGLGKVNTDGSAWAVLIRNSTHNGGGAAKVDLSSGTVTTLATFDQKQFAVTWGLEVYGSRRLVCNGTGKPGTSVQVNVQSGKAGDGGKSYVLACSRARRPIHGQCLKFPNGEYLFLDYSDPLFYPSALNLLPGVIHNFQGTLDRNGNATARVNIPSGLPPNLGIPIFVAGVIYDPTGVRTVTNTHWFVLS